MKLLLLVCLLGALSAVSADRFYPLNSSDVYQTWNANLRAIGTSSITGKLVVMGTSVDVSGSTYAVGYLSGVFQDRTSLNGRDGFVMKFAADGSPLWLRYLATYSEDYVSGCRVDAAGNLFVVGWTYGSMNGQPNAGGADGFVAKYSALGELLWFTQVGGGSDDFFYAVDVDPANNPVLVGMTYNQLGGRSFGSYDVFVAKYWANNGSVVWSNQFGSSSADYPYMHNSWETISRTISVTNYGDIYVGYFTDGTVSSSMPPRGSYDVYIMKLSPSGSLTWTVQLASNNQDMVNSVTADATGDVIVGGKTQGPIQNQLYAGNWDSWVAKISSQGQILWTRTFGHNGNQELYSIDTDLDGNSYAVGWTDSPTFDDEVNIAYSQECGSCASNIAFLTKMDTFGNRIYTRFFRVSKGTRNTYYWSTTTTVPTTVSAIIGADGVATGVVVGGIGNGLLVGPDEASYGDVVGYWASYLFGVSQSLNCTLNDYNDVLTEINNLFYSLNIQ